MINVMNLVQLKAFARQDGVLLALLWACSFLAVMLSPGSALGSLLALSTPFVVGWLLARFRDGALDGIISFRRAFAFSCYTFFYASLIFAAVQFVYFRFFDHGNLMSMMMENLRVMEQAASTQGAVGKTSIAQMKETAQIVGQLSPVQITFVIMMDNLLVGAFMSLPIALWGSRKKRAHNGNLPQQDL